MDSLNNILYDHVEQNPNTSPRDILLHHASNCELEKYGEDEPVKQKYTTKQTTTKQKRTRQPFFWYKITMWHRPKKGGKSSVKAIQEMQTSMAISNNFLSSFPSKTQGSAHMQVREMISELTTHLVVTSLQTPLAQPNNIPQGNAIAQRPGQCKSPRERGLKSQPL